MPSPKKIIFILFIYYLICYLHPRSIKSLFSFKWNLLTQGLLIIVPFIPPIKGFFEPKSPILLATYNYYENIKYLYKY